MGTWRKGWKDAERLAEMQDELGRLAKRANAGSKAARKKFDEVNAKAYRLTERNRRNPGFWVGSMR